MKARIIVLPGGQVQIMGDEGSFAQAQALTNQLIAKMQAGGVPITLIGTIEQHRDDVTHAHITTDTHHELNER